MRKSLVIFCLAVLGTVVVAGCNDENLVPYFTRWDCNADCGVAPLLVQFTARASGGDEKPDPTGANSYLDIQWDFRDGGSATGSIVYHTFTEPGVYDVALTVRDDDGDGETRYITVDVQADSLLLRTVPLGDGSEPDTTVTAGQPVPLTFYARTCGFPTGTGNYENRFLFHWRVDGWPDVRFDGRSPTITFFDADVGLRRVILTVEDDQYAVTRSDTVTVQVLENPGR